MVPETHRIVAGALSSYVKKSTGVQLDETKLLRGSIAPDIYPKYKFIPHYYDESIDYIVESIVHLVPYMWEILCDSAWAGLLVHAISYKIGVISHYLSDYMTHPHARRIRCTTMKDLRDHMVYERDLNRFVKANPLDLDSISFKGRTVTSCAEHDLRSIVKEIISRSVDLYLQESISFENDALSAYRLNALVLDTLCEAALTYGLQKQVQMA